ncbi:helix-turn-helix domain-containing protein [Paenibacillus sp. IHBB 10380]|uniref:helix-turn-helix domain-containing protein n=1 Tax=Paenibacillus sp. IHBB 10380 TaxID=1566358 RepID=UPI0005CFC9E8|nr:RodZ domain-containing protein [Paenibacillus sp. IHBB 10380]
MSELGQQLREARLEKGMSLDDVQEMTKIRKRYLEAIEAGDYKVLPGTFYVRAFIKTYAETVGLNPDELLEGHKQDVSSSEPESTMEPVIQKRSSNKAPSERNVKWLSTVLMWTFPILIVVVIYVYLSTRDDKPDANKVVDSGQKITDSQQDPSTQPKAPEVTPPTGNGGEAGTTPDEEGTVVPDEEPIEEPNPEQVPQSLTVTEDGKSGKNTIFKVAAPVGSKVQVEIKATGQSWMEIYRGGNSQGEKLFFNNTKDGDNLSFDLDSQGLYIKSGYSKATNITVGGQLVTDGKATSRILLKMGEPEENNSVTGE